MRVRSQQWMAISICEATTIGALIEALKELPAEAVVSCGFTTPHSYRGYYDELGVEPAQGVTIASMIRVLIGALDTTYEGYKGGDFVMREHTGVHFANYGSTGHPITPEWVELVSREAL